MWKKVLKVDETKTNLYMRTTVCERREQAETGCPESDCQHRFNQDGDAAESAEREYPMSNSKPASPRLSFLRLLSPASPIT
ncbi:hypothetical protein CHARACLAT_005824 [Characodon lateralis]|uniref:Uncharacterized protein n=1 Tax=Characodon lateralis TaxID=208331 RepID=A0ABU7ERS1_9TELE|nr:hypothetical protein [Characodon lateralis]